MLPRAFYGSIATNYHGSASRCVSDIAAAVYPVSIGTMERNGVANRAEARSQSRKDDDHRPDDLSRSRDLKNRKSLKERETSRPLKIMGLYLS